MNEPTRPEHPKFALERSAPQSRRIICAAVAIVALSFLSYLKYESGREQAALAHSKAANELQRQKDAVAFSAALLKSYKGESKNAQQKALLTKVGKALADKSTARNSHTRLRFRLLSEANAINLFAMPNGDIFVTTALMNRMQTEGQLAAALAHGVAHVLNHDGPVARETEPPALPLWFYSAQQERATDAMAVQLMADAGYDPNAMIGMFTVLLSAYQAGADVAFFTTHPNESARLQDMYATINKLFPKGVPAQLSK